MRTDGRRFAYECTSMPMETGAAKGTLAFFRTLAVDLDARTEEELRVQRERLLVQLGIVAEDAEDQAGAG